MLSPTVAGSDKPFRRSRSGSTRRIGRSNALTRPVKALAFEALSGSVPPELGNLSSLETLDLASNDLTGSIPPELGNLPRLEILDLSGGLFCERRAFGSDPA